jgi:(S)-2-hydroxyglutarate dehydrogenase
MKQGKNMLETDYLVVGAGIVGLSITRELVQRYPDARVVIIDKEPEVAFHASGRNSGVLHAGFYYTANSLKARFTVAGNKALTDYCLEHELPINRCGKVVVATTEEEVAGILELKRRGDVNGVDLKLIDEQELNDVEPNARTVQKALFSPTTSTIAPKLVCQHIASQFPPSVQLLFNCRLTGINRTTAFTSREPIGFRYLFNAAGLYADKIAHLYNVGKRFTVIPFKGIYLQYNSHDLIQRHIYPVPNLRNPFLGVHFTITVDRHIKIGPTAIPAFWRENYDFTNRFSLNEFREIVFREARLFLFNHFNFRHLAFEEMRKYQRDFFINESRKLVKKMDVHNFGDYTAPGIRAQLLNRDTNELVMDFLLEHAEHSTHVLNAVSPAFTTAFSFAKHIVDEAGPHMKG